MSTIKVPDTITTLSPDDTYPVVDLNDVGGGPELKASIDSHTAKIEANIDNVKALTKKGETFTYSGKTAPVYLVEPKGIQVQFYLST